MDVMRPDAARWILASLLAAVLMGGCVSVRAEKTTVPVPEEGLEAWLAEREAVVPDLVPGAEKTIVWAGERDQKTKHSLIYLHGFSATRQEIAPTLDRVAEEMGANLFYTRLAGHGRDGDAMGQAPLRAWKRDAMEAWEIGRRIGEEVVVVWTSTGAPLAAWLACGRGDIAAVALISANFQPANKAAKIVLWPGGRLITRLVVGKTRAFEPRNEAHARYWTTSYPSKALRPMMKACRLGERAKLEELTVPVLFLYTEHDDVVSLSALKEAYGRVGSPVKKLIDVKEAEDHVLAGDIISPQATDAAVRHILTFLEVL